MYFFIVVPVYNGGGTIIKTIFRIVIQKEDGF
jgi:hypothetical protein